MEQKEKIAVWLNKNLTERVIGNKYLNEEQIKDLSDSFSELIALNEKGEVSQDEVINRGNNTVERMNDMMNARRVETEVPKLEDYKAFLNKGPEELDQTNACKNIMGLFNVLLTAKRYDLVIEYINAVDLDTVQHEGIPLWIMTSTNPIDPLMRAIPKEEDIRELNIVRCGFYEKGCKYYEKLGKDYFKDGRFQPGDYDKQVAEYDFLYGGRAPRQR